MDICWAFLFGNQNLLDVDVDKTWCIKYNLKIFVKEKLVDFENWIEHETF